MSSVIVDTNLSAACKRRLAILGYNVIELPPYSGISSPVASHPDTLICRIGDELITSADYCECAAYVFSDIRERHPSIHVRFCDEGLAEPYPHDCAYNALVTSNRLIARVDSISRGVIDAAASHGLEICDTSQGYAACSTLTFRDADGVDHAVTADAGMAKTLAKCNVKVTKIGDIGINLPPYKYGFIGGASGVHGDVVYFIGNLDTHPDVDIIRRAIESAGLRVYSLSDELLCDCGGLIFLD